MGQKQKTKRCVSAAATEKGDALALGPQLPATTVMSALTPVDGPTEAIVFSGTELTSVIQLTKPKPGKKEVKTKMAKDKKKDKKKGKKKGKK